MPNWEMQKPSWDTSSAAKAKVNGASALSVLKVGGKTKASIASVLSTFKVGDKAKMSSTSALSGLKLSGKVALFI